MGETYRYKSERGNKNKMTFKQWFEKYIFGFPENQLQAKSNIQTSPPPKELIQKRTELKPFEEDFPELKKERTLAVNLGAMEPVIPIYVLEKHCKSNQRIREAIKKPIFFSERKKLAEEFCDWAIKNKAEICALNAITWFKDKHTKDLLKKLRLDQ